MKVNKLEVGPILGEVTSTQAKIFGRGKPEFIDNKIRRSHLVVHWRETKKRKWQPSHYSKLNPNFDMSAVGVLENLSASRSYEYQCGYIFSDVGSSVIDVEKVLEWNDVSINQFSTASNISNTQIGSAHV